MTTRILFLCTGNSARSQMAEGILRHVGEDKVEVFSAGTHPKGLHPLAVQVMAEVGIDISGQQSKSMDLFLDQPFDFVITVCDRANESCPLFGGGRQRLHWPMPDPAAVEGDEEQKLNAFCVTRDELFARIWSFLSLIVSGKTSV